ncbi:COP9 signalosome complex subunit 3 [Podospora aff. communis PSN243]|uniref:COP9 signalosome complex subunit 3 n=1 Tax=Podospora aff. communis PSN243 TaxID=3040156 RepID=A0AAV9GYX9_9PEZI|nr:COP9 signalosome complex subunit 3 [Podospora aff. communis PSN243]
MDQYASVLLAFPDGKYSSNEEYHRAVRQHVQKVEKLGKEHGAALGSHAAQLLEHVNPAVNSISYLTVLGIVVQRERAPQTNMTLLTWITRFLMTFDARQMRYAGSQFSGLLNLVGEGSLFPASVAVDLLATAILRVDPTGSILTSHHFQLVRLALYTDNIEPALPVIEKEIVFFPGVKGSGEGRHPCDLQLSPSEYITPESDLTGKLKASAVLQYDLLVAKCFIQRRAWQQAFDALERVITYPIKDQACSKIMTEAYNKWVLVGLLLNGKTPTLPVSVASSTRKVYSILGKPYFSLAEAFDLKTAEALNAEFASLGPQFWAEEGNLGLVTQVLIYYQRWMIVNLQKIYTKISIDHVRRLTQSAETGKELGTEAEVLALLDDMISTGMLNGRVEPAVAGKPAHLVFLAPAEELSEAEFATQMLQTAERIKDLGPIVKATNERLATTREYVRYMAREQKGGGKGIADFVGFNTQVEDEDLMTGIMTGH